jgi:hypothetical protein
MKDLSKLWENSCIRLYNYAEQTGRDADQLTIWDGFKLLYSERVPEMHRGLKGDAFSRIREGRYGTNVHKYKPRYCVCGAEIPKYHRKCKICGKGER